MKSFSSFTTFLFLSATANAQLNDAPTIAPTAFTDASSLVPTLTSVPASSSVPSFGGGGGVQSDRCEDNRVCAAMGITGLCCPTTSKQYLYCCGGVQEETCEANDRCADLGLTGACCPTAGHSRAELNGIYLDCCDSVPDSCASKANDTEDDDDAPPTTGGMNSTNPMGKQANGTTTEDPTPEPAGANATQMPSTTMAPSDEGEQCVQMSSTEFQKELAAESSGSRSVVWMGPMVASVIVGMLLG